MAVLELKGITKQYHSKTALNNVDLTINEGASIALFGPNGAGKTTLMKIMAGLMSPTRGTVLYKGKAPSESNLMKETYYLGHKNSLYNGLTVLENMKFIAGLFGRKDPSDIETVLREHNFWERRNDTVRELSQGMKRRLAIAKSFLTNPSLLILDEPFVGLDIKWRAAVLKKIAELRSRGASLLVSTHLVEEGYELADQIAFISNGHMKFIKNKEDVSIKEILELFKGQQAA